MPRSVEEGCARRRAASEERGMSMKVLVTGSEGYIGAVLAPMMLEHGFDVVGLDTGFYREGWLYNPGRPVLPRCECQVR